MLAANGAFDVKKSGDKYSIVGGGSGGSMKLLGVKDGDGLKLLDPTSPTDAPATMNFDKRTGDLVFGDGGSQSVYLKRG